MAALAECRYYNIEDFNTEVKRPSATFSAFHLNARSIKNKMNCLCLFLDDFSIKFDAILLTESWLSPSDNPPKISGYNYHGIVRSVNRGGGIALYIKNSIVCDVVNELTCITPNVECLVVRLKDAVVAAVYRPPLGHKSEFFEFMETLLPSLHSVHSTFVLMGDTNINMLSSDSSSEHFESVLRTYACTNLITLPTRITEKSATLLDICVSSVPSHQCTTGVFSFDISDHLPIFVSIPVAPQKHANIANSSYRDINPASLKNFYSDVETIKWDSVYAESDPDRAYRLFLHKITASYEKHFPLVRNKVKGYVSLG